LRAGNVARSIASYFFSCASTVPARHTSLQSRPCNERGSLHTTHLVTDTWDTAVLDALFFPGPLEGKRYVDVSENALYWYFVVLSWLPIYAVVYLAPRG
jgi:hypothetical protein